MAFSAKKASILSSPPFGGPGRDLSPKGSLDEPILDLIAFLNEHPNYVTTSSCSGRVSLYADTGTKGVDWLCVKHEEITSQDVFSAIQMMPSCETGDPLVVLKCEALILHVLCRDLESAQLLHQIVMECGYRESGVSVNKQVLVAVRTSSFGMEMPVAQGARPLLSHADMAIVVREANKRIRLNFERIDSLLVALKARFRWPRFQLLSPLPSPHMRRWGHASALADSRVLTLGGYGSPDASKPDAGSRAMPASSISLVSSAPEELIACSIECVHGVLVHLPLHRMFLLSGGRTSPAHPLPTCQLLTSDMTSVSCELRGCAVCPRWGHSLVEVSPGLYILYGGRDDIRVFDDAFLLTLDLTATPPACTWTQLVLSQELSGRFFHAAAAVHTRSSLLVHGGMLAIDGRASDSTFFTIDALGSVCVIVVEDGPPMNRFAHTITYIGAKTFLLLGGSSFAESSGVDAKGDGTGATLLEWKSVADGSAVLGVSAAGVGVEAGRAHHQTLFDQASRTVLVLGGGLQCMAFGPYYCPALRLRIPSAGTTSTPDVPLAQSSELVSESHSRVALSSGKADSGSNMVMLVPALKVKAVKTLLESRGALDKSKRITSAEYSVDGALRVDLLTGALSKCDEASSASPADRLMAVPLSPECYATLVENEYSELLDELRSCLEAEAVVMQSQSVRDSKAIASSCSKRAREYLESLVRRFDLAALEHEIPGKYEMVGDVLMIPELALLSPEWVAVTRSGESVWKALAAMFGLTRVARKARIDGGEMRKSHVTMLYSATADDGWVTVLENGISFGFYITRVMFCSGNCSERIRAASFPVENKVVVDLYCGIGYYTLPLLVHGKAKFIHAFEMNPDSVYALRRNLQAAGVPSSRFKIYEGDNQITSTGLVGVADCVSLGLLPSSEAGWSIAVRVLKREGGVLHVHETVHEQRLRSGEWIAHCLSSLAGLFEGRGTPMELACAHIERVKSYAPRVLHIVADIVCVPKLDPA